MSLSAKLPEAWNGRPRSRGIDAHLPWNAQRGEKMTRTNSDICDSIGISFVQNRHGWSDLIFVHDSQVLNCGISNVFTDDISELLKLCDAILDNRSEVVNLMDEPDGHRLSIDPDPEQHHVMTIAISGLTAMGEIEAEPLLMIRTKRKQLLTLLMTELWKLLYFHAEPAFQRDRSEFGHAATLLRLNSRWDADQRLGPSILK